jgi:hypothetical protein
VVSVLARARSFIPALYRLSSRSASPKDARVAFVAIWGTLECGRLEARERGS